MSLLEKTIKYIGHYYYYSIVFACSSDFMTNENEKKMTTAIYDLPFLFVPRMSMDQRFKISVQGLELSTEEKTVASEDRLLPQGRE
jgi:hypothetical protein